MDWRFLTGLILLLAVASAAPAIAGDAQPRVPTREEIARCPKLQGVDWKKVRKRALAAEPGGAARDPLEEHRRIRGPRPLPDLGRAETAFDISIGAGETQEYPTSTSSFVWREKGGPWLLDRVDYSPIPPSPPPPDSGIVVDEAWNELAKRPVTRGPLSTAQARSLDKLLADPCFRAQPDVVPFVLPMKKGGDQRCFGMIGSTVRMQAGETVRYLSDPCGRGYGYDLASIVMYGSLDLGTLVQRALAARLKHEGVVLTDAKLGKSGSVATMVCGTAQAPAAEPVRFTYTRWMQGPYAIETLFLSGDPDWMIGGTFAAHWERHCPA